MFAGVVAVASVRLFFDRLATNDWLERKFTATPRRVIEQVDAGSAGILWLVLMNRRSKRISPILRSLSNKDLILDPPVFARFLQSLDLFSNLSTLSTNLTNP